MNWFSISKLPNPLETPPWSDVDIISIGDISAAINRRNYLKPEEVIRNIPCSKEDHIRRIAYLVENEDYKPITLRKVGKWPIKDGSHRLAAAIYRGDQWIRGRWI